MLIKCKECGKEISSQADFCPHCGIKNEKTVICSYCKNDSGKTYEELQNLQEEGHIEICKNCGKEIIVMSKYEEILSNKAIREEQIKPKCPTCGSTNLSKVSAMSKVGSVAMFGLLSQKVKKTWHCNNCKYEW